MSVRTSSRVASFFATSGFRFVYYTALAIFMAWVVQHSREGMDKYPKMLYGIFVCLAGYNMWDFLFKRRR